MSPTADEIAALGLALDIVGAILLAKGFMLKGVRGTIRESGSYYGYNSHLRNSLIEQTVEARFGMAFLASGFSCQAAPYMVRMCSGRIAALWAIAITLGVGAWLAAIVLSRRMIRKLNRTVALKEISEKESNHYTLSEKELQRLEKLSDVQRLPGEKTDETLSRMKQVLERQPRYDI